jgi:hypothetical protein
VALVDFAFAMMTVLQAINKDCFNDFKLRVGLTVGPVVAGMRLHPNPIKLLLKSLFSKCKIA